MTDKCKAGGPFCDALTAAVTGDNGDHMGINWMHLCKDFDTGAGSRKAAFALRYGKKKDDIRWVHFCPFCGADVHKDTAPWVEGIEIHDKNGIRVEWPAPE
jgi:hypothetical protein